MAKQAAQNLYRARTFDGEPHTKPQHSGQVHVNGIDLAYREEGSGDAVVLIHGSADDLRSWSRQLEAFSKQYRVIAYSRRYHYPNCPPANGAEYTGLLHAEDLAGLIARLGIGPAHLVGSSYGGCVALLVALHYPHLVRSLVLGEPPIMPLLAHRLDGVVLARDFMDNVWAPARQAFRRREVEQGMRVFLDSVLGIGAFDRLSASARRKILQNAPEMRAEVETAEESYFSTSTCADAQAIDMPILLLTGELSPMIFHLITDEVTRRVSHAERATIPHASHVMHTTNPDAYNRKVLDFLAKL